MPISCELGSGSGLGMTISRGSICTWHAAREKTKDMIIIVNIFFVMIRTPPMSQEYWLHAIEQEFVSLHCINLFYVIEKGNARQTPGVFIRKLHASVIL